MVVESVHFHRVVGRVNYFPSRGGSVGFRSLFRNGIYALSLFRLLLGPRLQVDVVDANSIPWLHLPAAWLLARWWRARFVITVHEAFGSAIASYFEAKRVPFAKLQGRCAGAFYRWSQSLGDEIVAASPSCVDGIRREGARQQITILNSGQEVASLDEIQFDAFPITLVTTGRLVQMKRIEVLLHAAFALGDPMVHVIGDGPLSDQLHAAASSLRLKNTEFHGWVDEKTKRNILLRSQIFVLTSYREGWSLATLEAMAHGCLPIFASRPARYQTGVAIYAHPGANSLDFDGSVEGLVDRIRLACTDAGRLSEMRRNAWETARSYSWSASIAAAEHLYRKSPSICALSDEVQLRCD
jgi:glycosyltransferase involved in cell wall biosynthesis